MYLAIYQHRNNIKFIFHFYYFKISHKNEFYTIFLNVLIIIKFTLIFSSTQFVAARKTEECPSCAYPSLHKRIPQQEDTFLGGGSSSIAPLPTTSTETTSNTYFKGVLAHEHVDEIHSY